VHGAERGVAADVHRETPMKSFAATAICFAIVASALAQTRFPFDVVPVELEVISVRPNASGGTTATVAEEPRRVRFFNATPRDLVRVVYSRLHPQMILNLPAWAEMERFDIAAQWTEGQPRPTTESVLLAVLMERFAFEARQELRANFPVYELRRARADGQLGPRIRFSDADCTGGGLSVFATGISLTCSPWSADVVTAGVDRPVADTTGIQGHVDVVFRWNKNPLREPPPDVEPEARVSLFTALQEQLGLELEPSTAAVDVLVVDRLRRPSRN
jgi:uncharacterized protein (TIGR03435 family)